MQSDRSSFLILRVFVWIGMSVALSIYVTPSFFLILNQTLIRNFGTIFPAIPFVALLFALLLIHRNEVKGALAQRQATSQWALIGRIIGLVLITSVIWLRGSLNHSISLAGIGTVLLIYGSSLVLNIGSRRIFWPYVPLCIMLIGLPALAEWSIGEPLAYVSALLSHDFVSVTGIPAAWQGTQFEFISLTGDHVSATVAPACSSMLSITTFLGLLVLMHLDLKKDRFTTLTLAVAGIITLTALNSLRILILIWIGYTGGAALFWNLHNWIGYVIFLGFYFGATVLYARTGKLPHRQGFFDGLGQTKS